MTLVRVHGVILAFRWRRAETLQVGRRRLRDVLHSYGRGTLPLYAGLLFIAPLLSIGMMLGLAALSNRSPDPAAHIPLGWSLVVAVPVALLVEAVGLLAWIRVRRAEIVNACIAQGKPAPNQPLAPPLRRLEQALVRFEQAFDSETRRRGQWHCPRCGRRIPDEKAPPTTAIGGRGLQPGWRRSSSS